jgi:hypothetical protein
MHARMYEGGLLKVLPDALCHNKWIEHIIFSRNACLIELVASDEIDYFMCSESWRSLALLLKLHLEALQMSLYNL